MTTIAILPLKRLDEAKQRLSPTFDPPTRRSLVQAMFSDALVALRRATTLECTIVVTSDHNAQRIAAGYGAEVIAEGDGGHNVAAARGVDRALALVHRIAPAPSMLVVPDRHGTGTNALLLSPPDALTPSFGPDSRDRHLALAERAGVAAEVVEIDGLALDVDTAADLQAVGDRLEQTHGGAAHTRGLLTQLSRSRG